MAADPYLEKLRRDYADGAHSIFSPSSGQRILDCRGSLIPNVIGENQTSLYAAEGTVAHELAEHWLTTGVRPDERVGEVVKQEGYEIEITGEMLDYIEKYVEHATSKEGIEFNESLVDISAWCPVPRQFGKVDRAVIVGRTLYIYDLKYGQGKRVDVFRNVQVALYALGFYLRYDWLYGFEQIEIMICQPRLDYFGTWVVAPAELLEFGEEIRIGFDDAWRMDAPRTPTEAACYFCKIKANCPEHLAAFEKAYSDITGYLDDEIEVLPKNYCDCEKSHNGIGLGGRVCDCLAGSKKKQVQRQFRTPTERLIQIFKMKKQFGRLFYAVECELESRLNAGESLPGIVQTEGRSNRSWLFPEAETAQTLLDLGIETDEFTNHTLKSPAQLEKVLQSAYKMKAKAAKAYLAHLVHKPRGQIRLLLSDDPDDGFTPVADVLDEVDVYLTDESQQNSEL